MANKSLFQSLYGRLAPARVRNEAGGLAYEFVPKHALAQFAATGCFSGTYYSDATEQLSTLRALVNDVSNNEFLTKLAIYARERALMKDMPAALLVILAQRDTQLLHRVFDRVVDNGRMLRTVLQMIRSGQFGKKSLSASLQRAFQRWLNQASVGKLLSASIGKNPSLRDVLRLARPTPADNARRALFGWLTEKPVEKWAPATLADLPQEVRALAAYRAATSEAEQVEILRTLNVRWDLLADTARGPRVWQAIARQMGPQALRMNLNTLLRQGAFAGEGAAELVDFVAGRLADAEEIVRSRQFPYQFLAAYLNASADVPSAIKAALHRAAEIACGNVPALPGPVVIGLDVSGSMSVPVTGYRGDGATSKMRCIDVAALIAAAILRRNPDSVVIPFDDSAHSARLDPQDTILSLAERLAQYGGGGTNCALPLQTANVALRNKAFVGCVLVSDQESWIGAGRYGATETVVAWDQFVKNQARLQSRGTAGSRLVCIDLQPNKTTQAPEREDILNIGGFSDAVFGVISSFFVADSGRFVSDVEAVQL